jgi:hypothetical protein
MARPERYKPDQWEHMSRPETQVRIRAALSNYMRSFLDTAPEGGELSRAREVILMFKAYFERELQTAEELPNPDRDRASIAEQVLIPLASYFHIATLFETGMAAKRVEIPQSPELSPEELDKKIEEWRKFEERLRREGKEHWWET